MDQPFPHNPEPSRQNIGRLCERVVESGSHLGFALDADADRLAIVNEKGEPLGEDCTVSIAVYRRLLLNPGPVVVNLSTSRMVDDIAAQAGCPVFRTRVGEVHVVEKMQQTGAEIGGEGNGGVIFRPVNPCRDAFVGMGLVLEALAALGGSMSELRQRLPRYSMVKEKLTCAGRDIAPSMRLLQKLYAGENIDLTDGVKVIWPDRWLHVRPSGTEPIIRLIAEAPKEPEARTLLLQALECLSPTT
jgi:phosphomannomutase